MRKIEWIEKEVENGKRVEGKENRLAIKRGDRNPHQFRKLAPLTRIEGLFVPEKKTKKKLNENEIDCSGREKSQNISSGSPPSP